MITTVVFDLDDTLYDEMDYCRSGFAAVAEHLAALPEYPSVQAVFDELWNQFTAGNRTKTLNAALDRLGIPSDDQTIRRLIELYRAHVPTINLPDDAKKVLDRLAADYTLALLTDGFLPAQQLKVRALGIEHYFKCIIYTEQLGRQFWKPSPAGFEKLIQTLNVSPQNAAYVADNDQKDFIAPNSLGIATIKVVRPRRIHTESSTQPQAQPMHTILGIDPLPALLAHL
ncbi:MAG TPA: HAD family hydrolase [Sedimentisphaerales bacterium]|nr:HAD family hydrolase [Sedimentisphaerales bacterium]